MENNNLKIFQELLYKYYQLDIKSLIFDRESNEYGACKFRVNGLQILYRASKITPTKIGQFVTVWKRSENKLIAPYSIKDNLDYLIISTQKLERLGYFIFPSSILFMKDIFANQYGKGGKRGFRIYPVWDIPTNKQAIQSQNWQTKYFLDCSNTNLIDGEKMKAIFQPFL